MITLRHITYTYPQAAKPALRDVSLEIGAGEFVLVVGESGAGKSSLLRLFNGLVPHFTGGRVSGEALVAGHNPITAGPSVMSRHVGFVFQNPEAQMVLAEVEPEIAFGLENLGYPPDEMRLRVEEVLSLLDLAHLRQRPLITLSGGERQRVAIACALALRPQILVLDEPTSQLDPQSAEEVLQALVRLNEDLGLTIILAEHRLERVLRYADRLLYIRDGQLAADGSPAEVCPVLPHNPPLVQVALALGWRPLPLTIKAGQRFAGEQGSRGAGAQRSGGAEERRGQGTNDKGQMTNDPLLEVRGVGMGYGGQEVLRGVDVAVGAGEVVALMGRNGAGKTTLLRGIMNLQPLGRGRVLLHGRETAGQTTAALARHTAYLPQNPDDLLFAETVREELHTTLRHHKLTAEPAQIEALLDELGLAGLAEAYPRDLSVGQRQRVALAALLITNPTLLLLDEPTRGLDYGAKESLIALWRRWQAQGKGVLLVTHDVELVAQVATRVVVLGQGEVIAEGKTAAVLPPPPSSPPKSPNSSPTRAGSRPKMFLVIRNSSFVIRSFVIGHSSP